MEEFLPVQIPRKGEYIAWSLAAVGFLCWALLLFTGSQVQNSLKIITLLITISALLISLSNWVDRNTHLLLDNGGISYYNGLRRTRLAWDDIRQVDVIPSLWGKRVRVIGTNTFFDFRTVGEVAFRGQTRLRLGFEKGEQILQRVIASAQLKK